MDRQKECTRETLVRMRRELKLGQSFVNEAVDYWENWDITRRRMHTIFHVMLSAVLESTDLAYPEARKKVVNLLRYIEE